jgi:dolichol-phosphate mannosyltransferase
MELLDILKVISMRGDMKPSNLPLISICIPVLNEQDNVLPLYDELNDALTVLEANYEFEFIFSDNNSEDETWSRITQLSLVDSRVKAIRFTRNIGFQESIRANYTFASGVAVIQIDADLQDPPKLIVDLVNEWEKGFKVVYGARVQRKEGLLLSSFRKAGYRVISQLSDFPIPNNAGDFRLMDREVVERLISSKTPNPYIRGIVAGYGYPAKAIPYSRRERVANDSKFPVRRIITLGMDGILNHSSRPLTFSAYSGLFILFASILLSIYYLMLKIFDRDLPQGLASIHILVTFGIGMNAIFLGVIGSYLNRIYTILRNEDRFIVRDRLNLEGKK